MDRLTRGQTWGLAAIVGCGACCGGLLGNAAWVASTAFLVGGLVAAWVWGVLGAALVAGVGAAVLLAARRRRADSHPSR